MAREPAPQAWKPLAVIALALMGAGMVVVAACNGDSPAPSATDVVAGSAPAEPAPLAPVRAEILATETRAQRQWQARIADAQHMLESTLNGALAAANRWLDRTAQHEFEAIPDGRKAALLDAARAELARLRGEFATQIAGRVADLRANDEVLVQIELSGEAMWQRILADLAAISAPDGGDAPGGGNRARQVNAVVADAWHEVDQWKIRVGDRLAVAESQFDAALDAAAMAFSRQVATRLERWKSAARRDFARAAQASESPEQAESAPQTDGE